jgi:hypothetical protein
MKKNNKYDWLFFSQSYLNIARLACEELIEKKHGKLGLRSRWEYHLEELIVPILYNVKHGIEIFIKTISIIIDGKHDEGHNIKELFEKLKEKIKVLKSQSSQEKGFIITQEMIENFPKNLDKIEGIVNEFYSVEMLIKKLENNFEVYDKKNDIFRYPDNKANIKIEWCAVLSKFQKKEILELRDKIENLYQLFNETGDIIAILQKIYEQNNKENK